MTIDRIVGMDLKLDNSYHVLDSLRSFIAHSDGEASLSMYQKDSTLTVYIKPSNSAFKQDIINNLLAFRKMLGIKIIFSKSLSVSDNISFVTTF